MFGIFDQAVFLDQLLGVQGLRGDVRQVQLGRPHDLQQRPCSMPGTPPRLKKIEAAFTNELIVTPPADTASRMNWTALNTLVGTRFKLLTGYEGPATAKIAMERGEVDALSGPWAVLQEEHPDWIKEKKVNVLLQTGLEKNQDVLPELPA